MRLLKGRPQIPDSMEWQNYDMEMEMETEMESYSESIHKHSHIAIDPVLQRRAAPLARDNEAGLHIGSYSTRSGGCVTMQH